MVRRIWAVVLVLIAAGASDTAAQPTDLTKPVIDKAVQALGGADKQKLPGITFDTKAKFTVGNENVEFSGSWTAMGHANMQTNLAVNVNGRQENITFVVNPKDVWLQAPNGKTEMPPAGIAPSVRAIVRAVSLAQRPGQLADKDLKVSSLGEFQVNNVACVGLKVEQKDQRDISLYFDKANGLPVKSEVTILENPNGQDVPYAFLFSEFKEVQGVKHPTKLTVQRDNQQVLEMEVSNIQLHENVNMNLFQKP
jgi:hypothetical protein